MLHKILLQALPLSVPPGTTEVFHDHLHDLGRRVDHFTMLVGALRGARARPPWTVANISTPRGV